MTTPYNPWQAKPWWCQPWSILLTGCTIVGGSWIILHRWWLTALVAVPIALWMGFFLILWPRWMQQYMEDMAAPSPDTSPSDRRHS